jgi:HK97 family phage prohead protease
MNIRITENAVEIDGYVNAVERLSKPLKDRLGEFVERIKVGAFKRALERTDDVRILLNHDWSRDLGGIKDGNLELHEDAIGLHARATITDKEVVEQAKRGELRGWSFGFTDRDVEKGEENGLTVRNVKDLDLYEVSLINRQRVPAYDGTLVAVRAADETLYNLGDVTETETKLEERTEEKTEERTEEPEPNEDNADEKGALDYTEYHKIIEEMKGEKSL